MTNGEGSRAFEIARRIALLCRTAAWKREVKSIPSLANTPLFVSVAYLGLLGSFPIGGEERLVTQKFDFSENPVLRAALQPFIEEADLQELEKIDPYRAWRTESAFQLGKRWTLTTHQLRRSLALYAQRSGLVSLPSLRRQLQHLTEEMSRYYARGSAFADNFIGNDKKHFGYEWRAVQPVSSALGYLALVTSGEPLFGAHGAWIEHRLRSNSEFVLGTRDETIAQFKKGEMAYRETLLGGCTSTAPCKLKPVRWLNLECVTDCKNMVGRKSRLRRVIAAQRKLLARLDPETAEARQQQADLDALVGFEQETLKSEGREASDVQAAGTP